MMTWRGGFADATSHKTRKAHRICHNRARPTQHPASALAQAPTASYVTTPFNMSANNSDEGLYKMIALCAIGAYVSICCIHPVQEGKTATYKRGGHLIDRTESAGYSLKAPLIDTVVEIQHSMQTDNVTDVLCGTSGGVMVSQTLAEHRNRFRCACL